MPCKFTFERPAPYAELNPGCQFQIPGLEQITHLGHGDYCPFHLPQGHISQIGQKKNSWEAQHVTAFNEAVAGFVAAARDEGRPVDLTGVQFPAAINFTDIAGPTRSLPGILLVGVEFPATADFRGITFTGDAVFDGVHFTGGAHFDGVTFEGIVQILAISGPGAANLGSSSFVGTVFRKTARFAQSIFSHSLFSEARFELPAHFENTNFYEADFSQATFMREVTFQRASFMVAKFSGARFEGKTNFNDARFGEDALFPMAFFGSNADFSGQITQPTPEKSPTFSKATFRETHFLGRATFANRQFLGPTDFSGAVFEVAPEFHGCRFHQDTDFRNTVFRDEIGKSDVNAARAYRTLRQAMESDRARKEQGMFYALEQRALRKSRQVKGPAWLFSLLYDIGSGYGQKIGRPAFSLILVTLVSFGFYAFLISAQGSSAPGSAFSFAIEQIIRPFVVWTTSYSPPEDMGMVWATSKFMLRLFATLQSLVSLGLVTLFILALRRGFKMD